MQMKNMSIVPCIHTYCNEEHEYSDCIQLNANEKHE